MKKSVFSLLCLTLLISACAVQQEQQSSPEQSLQKQETQKQDSAKQQGAEDSSYNEVSPGEVKLDVAQKANQIALQTKGVQHVSSVAIDKELSLAVEVRQLQRWNLDKIRKEIFHHLRDAFPELEVHVSTDRKILWELQKLERDMYASNPDVQAIQKKLKKVNEDMKG